MTSLSHPGVRARDVAEDCVSSFMQCEAKGDSEGCKERCEPMRAGQAARCRNFRSERTQHEVEWHFPECQTLIPAPQFLAPTNVYLRHTLPTPEELRTCRTKSGSKHLETAEK